MKNIILLCSSGQRVGKTTLANYLLINNIAQLKTSFAGAIKEVSYLVHEFLDTNIVLTKQEFFQDKKDDKLLSRKIS